MEKETRKESESLVMMTGRQVEDKFAKGLMEPLA